MTQLQMEYFRKTAELKNIAAAAEALFVSRAVVSRAISELENEFGSKLFLRSKSGVCLTEAGEAVYTLVCGILSGIRSTREYCRQSEAMRESTVRVGVSVTNSLLVWQRYAEPYLRVHPESRLSLIESPAEENWRKFLAHETDVCFNPGRPAELPALFGCTALEKTHLMLGVPAGDSLASKTEIDISDILDRPLGCLQAPMPYGDAIRSEFAGFGKEPNIVVKTANLQLLREMTERGICLPILPESILSAWNGVSAVPLRSIREVSHCFFWNRAVPQSPCVADFIASVCRGR